MKKITLPFFCLFICTSLMAQTNWITPIGTNSISIKKEPYGAIVEKENTIISLTANRVLEVSHFGELIHEFVLPTSGSIQEQLHYYFMDQKTVNDSCFILAARVDGENGGTLLYTALMDGTVIMDGFYLEDELVDEIKGLAAVKASDGNYLFFGKSKIYKLSISGPNTSSIIWTKDKLGGPVSSVTEVADGFITTSELGLLEKYSLDGDLIWSEDLGYTLFDLTVVDDGFITCGYDETESMTVVKKTNFNGNVEWENSFDAQSAYDIEATDDDHLLITGHMTGGADAYIKKLDSTGNEIWNKVYDFADIGITVKKSRYGGIIFQTKRLGSYVGYLDKDGNFERMGYYSRMLDVNNIATTVSASMNLFIDEGYNAAYKIKNRNSASTIFMSSLWLGAMDANNELHVALTQYGAGNYYPGPSGNNDPDYWNQVWELNDQEVQGFVADLSDGQQDAPVPLSFLWYPGNGNPNIKYNNKTVTIDQNYAPFEDVNNDGIYNVYDGDYPTVKGDEMLWWMSHDLTDQLYNAMGVDIVGSLYAFKCGDEIIENAVFLELDVTNVSQNTYTDLYTSLWTDFDLGCYTDDYVGVMPEQNSVYVYNSDDEDQTCQGGVLNFGTDIPIQSITLLNQELSSSILFNNGSFNNPPPPTTEPITSQEYYNFMQGLWKDGTAITIGGTGYNPGSMDYTNYAFPDNPSDASGWSMCSEGLSDGDRRIVPSSGPITFAPGQTLSLHYGMLTDFDIIHPCPDVTSVEENIEVFQGLYDDYIVTGLYNGFILDLGPDGSVVTGEVLDAGSGAATYEWSTGDTTQTIVPMSIGVYSVTITTLSGCVFEDIIEVGGVGVQEDLMESFTIFPNPTTGVLHIQLGERVPSKMELLSLQGKALQTFDLSQVFPESQFDVDVSSMTAGVYLLRTWYADGNTTVDKVVLLD